MYGTAAILVSLKNTLKSSIEEAPYCECRRQEWIIMRPNRWLAGPGGGTPICRPISSASIMTPFLRKSYAQWPHFHYSPHPMTRPPPIFFKIFNVKFQILRARLARFKNLCQFSAKNGKFLVNFDKSYTELWRPILVSSHQKCHFFIPNPMTPVFLRSLTPNIPCFRSPAYTRHFHIRVPPPPAIAGWRNLDMQDISTYLSGKLLYHPFSI